MSLFELPPLNPTPPASPCVDLAAGLDVDRFDHGVAIRVDAGFHLHRLDRQQQRAFGHLLARRTGIGGV